MEKLNPKALPYIYREPLYKLEVQKPEQGKGLNFRGKNLKNITVMIDDGSRVYSGVEFTLLKNILKAIGLTENDVAIIDLSQELPGVENIREVLSPRIIIAFGSAFPLAKGPKNQISEREDTKILITDSLSDLNQDEHLKRSFWAELQKLKPEIR